MHTKNIKMKIVTQLSLEHGALPELAIGVGCLMQTQIIFLSVGRRNLKCSLSLQVFYTVGRTVRNIVIGLYSKTPSTAASA